jgi:hypothetical protein
LDQRCCRIRIGQLCSLRYSKRPLSRPRVIPLHLTDNTSKVTLNDYNYYASGRQNLLYALFKLELKRRQCLFSTCTLELIWPRKDMVTIEVPIKLPE